jgi:hypothetical protein
MAAFMPVKSLKAATLEPDPSTISARETCPRVTLPKDITLMTRDRTRYSWPRRLLARRALALYASQLHRQHRSKRDVIIDEHQPMPAKRTAKREAGYRGLGYRVADCADFNLVPPSRKPTFARLAATETSRLRPTFRKSLGPTLWGIRHSGPQLSTAALAAGFLGWPPGEASTWHRRSSRVLFYARITT